MLISNVLIKPDDNNCGKGTQNIFHQIPVCNGYRIVSEIEEVLPSEYHHSKLEGNSTEWFINQMIEIESK